MSAVIGFLISLLMFLGYLFFGVRQEQTIVMEQDLTPVAVVQQATTIPVKPVMATPTHTPEATQLAPLDLLPETTPEPEPATGAGLPASAVAIVLEMPEPMLAERQLYDLFAFADTGLTPANWRVRDASDQNNQSSIIWENNTSGALAQVVAYNFGDPAAIETFFDAAFLDVIWGAYQPWQIAAQCETTSGVRLYQIDGELNDIAYSIHYWLHPLDDSTVRSLSLVYPAELVAELAETSQRLYPNYAECP